MNEATPNFDAGRGPGGRVNPAALPVAVAAQMLSAAGGQWVSVEGLPSLLPFFLLASLLTAVLVWRNFGLGHRARSP